jgi:signal transduction histidine kinase/CheY-like chemotaxis protein
VILAKKKYACTPGQFCAALRKTGFSLVYEASFGADVVTKVYTDYIAGQVRDKGRENTHVIASPCPALMNYVEKHVPSLIDEFAPIMSPMAVQAVLARYWNEGEIAVIGANPCVTKKSELLDEELGLYDEDLTFEELIEFIDSREIIPSMLEESDFDGIQAYYGAGFPISGGLTKTLEQFTDLTEFNPIGNDYIILEGEDRSTHFLKKMALKKSENGNLSGYPLLIDLLYCEGCILGKSFGIDSDLLENRRIVSEYTQKRFERTIENEKKYKGYSILVKNTVEAPEFEKWLETVDVLIKNNKFTRTWCDKHYERKLPGEEEMRFILESDGKFASGDELNCGACGYLTCRERAIAVYNGENVLGGCVIHMKHEAKLSSDENLRLRELDKMKTEFMSTVSHELRTPLTSVLGFAKIIKKRFEDVLFPLIKEKDKKVERAVRQVKDNVDIIISEGERLTTLINDVLDLAKMEAGRVEWKIEPLSVEEIIDRAVAATSSLFEQKGLAIKMEIQGDLPMVPGDRDRLIQTVINLISNAVKFTPQGSVTCKAAFIGNEVTISVIDTGIGIAKEDQGGVFEKFKQVGDTLTDKPKGTGLGLPICKQIVEQHGGRIWVNSKPGEGSIFTFAIPVSEETETAQNKTIDLDLLVKQLTDRTKEGPPGSEWAGGKEILVVDDDTGIRQLLRQELEAVGYNVREAGDGIDAIDKIKKKRPDLIILDVMMPGMNGFDTAAVLKNDPQTAEIPVVILSVLEDRDRGYRIGVDRYFTKPYNTDNLIDEIGTLLSRGSSRKKVLVVDEDRSTLKTISDALESRGYTVVEASEGTECIKKALSEQPDMIIIDTICSEKANVVKTLRYEKGLENLIFIILDKNEKSNGLGE